MRSIFKLPISWFFLTHLYVLPAFSQKELIDEVFEIVEQHSINRDSLDFKKIKEVAYNSYTSQSNGDPQDSYRVIRIIVSQLNDHHSFFMEKDQVNKWQNTSKQENVSFPFSGKV